MCGNFYKLANFTNRFAVSFQKIGNYPGRNFWHFCGIPAAVVL